MALIVFVMRVPVFAMDLAVFINGSGCLCAGFLLPLSLNWLCCQLAWPCFAMGLPVFL